jgi:hypothetical protein
MYDRPNAQELLDAVRLHLEQHVIAAVRSNPRLYFQTLVAINVIKIVGREMSQAEQHAAAEWTGLNVVQNTDHPLPANLTGIQSGLSERYADLCAAIRSGQYDDVEPKQLLFEHVKAVTMAQLQVANPRYLQQVMQE